MPYAPSGSNRNKPTDQTTNHVGVEEWRQPSLYLHFYAVLITVIGQLHAPTALPPGKQTQILIEQKDASVWKLRRREESLAMLGIESRFLGCLAPPKLKFQINTLE
jgi:hypothetical protein